jgi:hypothetical protein
MNPDLQGPAVKALDFVIWSLPGRDVVMTPEGQTAGGPRLSGGNAASDVITSSPHHLITPRAHSVRGEPT